MRSPDGIAWAGKQLYGNEGSYGNPVLAGSSNQLLVAWNGTDNSHNLNVGCIVCTGLPYGTKSTYSPGSDYGVGVAAVNDNFFISIRRNVSPQTVTVLSAPASNPVTFTEQGSVGTSVRGRGIAGSGGFAYVGWVGSGNLLNVATFQVLGTTAGLVSQSQIGMETSNTNPALAIPNGHLYYAWLGTDTRINIVQLF